MNRILIILLSFVISSYTLIAQAGSFGVSDSKSLGLGNTGNTLSGILSIGKNPALLANADTAHSLQILLPAMSAQSSSNTLSLSDINYYFDTEPGSPRVLTGLDKRNINAAFEGGGRLHIQSNLNPVSLLWKAKGSEYAFGFSVNDYFSARLNMPAELVDLILYGNEPGRTYSFDDFRMQAWWVRNYAISISKEIYRDKDNASNRIYAGGSAKYYQGFAYTDIIIENSHLTTAADNKISGKFRSESATSYSNEFFLQSLFDPGRTNPDFMYFPSPAAWGLGLDLGVAAVLDNKFVLSLSATDLGFLSWSTNAEKHSSSANVELDDIVKGNQLDSLGNSMNSNSEQVASFRTYAPAALRLGISLKVSEMAGFIPGDMTVAFDINTSLIRFASDFNLSRYSAGIHWVPDKEYPIVLTGINYDQAGLVRWSLGTGYSLGFIDVYVSTGDVLSLLAGPQNFSSSFMILWRLL